MNSHLKIGVVGAGGLGTLFGGLLTESGENVVLVNPRRNEHIDEIDAKGLTIVDDAGDEFYATNIPIPFYIRLKLENEKTKYRAKILDEAGNTRSFYTGVTERNFLELHVPVIPLREKGKIIVEIEVSDIDSSEATKHQATIDYVSQEEYESIKKTEKPEEGVTGESDTSRISQYEKIDEDSHLGDALSILKKKYEEQKTGNTAIFHKTMFVTDASKKIVGKLSMYDLIRELVPETAREPGISRAFWWLSPILTNPPPARAEAVIGSKSLMTRWGANPAINARARSKLVQRSGRLRTKARAVRVPETPPRPSPR